MSRISLAIPKSKPVQPADGNSILPFGKYKGEKLGDIPAWYLIWLYDEDWFANKYSDIYMYIENNYHQLEKENEANDSRDSFET